MNDYIKYLQPILQKKSTDKLVLYGAGEIGKQVYKELKNMHLQNTVAFFIDSNQELQKNVIEGYNVYSLEQAKEIINKTDLILITSSYYEEIKILLKEAGFLKVLRCDNLWYFSFYYNFENKNYVENVVEFYLVDAFEIYHYYPIYIFLREKGINARIIAEEPRINTSHGEWFDYETAVFILNDLHIEYSLRCNPFAKWAVTTQEIGVLEKYQNKKINMVYGISLIKNNFCLSKKSAEGFDYKFVHSNVTKKIMNVHMSSDKVFVMGYPRHIDFFNQIHSKDKILNELEIETDKPKLIYLPTWDQYNSIKSFADKIRKLKEKYYIVCKMHHCTARLEEKKEDRNILYSICDKILPANYSLENVAIIADAIIADAKSGVATEISYLVPEIPSILLWPFSREEIIDNFNKDLFEIAPVAIKEDNLNYLLELSMQYGESRKRIIKKYYGEQGKNEMENILAIFQ